MKNVFEIGAPIFFLILGAFVCIFLRNTVLTWMFLFAAYMALWRLLSRGDYQ